MGIQAAHFANIVYELNQLPQESYRKREHAHFALLRRHKLNKQQTDYS